MTDKPAEPTTPEIQAAHDNDVEFYTLSKETLGFDGVPMAYVEKFERAHERCEILLRRLVEAEKYKRWSGEIADYIEKYEEAQARLDELQYRHECLKSLYEDATNCKDPAQAETDIDEFIREEQLHS